MLLQKFRYDLTRGLGSVMPEEWAKAENIREEFRKRIKDKE